MPASDYRGLIQAAVAELWPVTPSLWKWVEAQVEAESGGNPIAISPTGARGLMQLEPATAAEMGVTNLDDPEDNIRGGVKYDALLWGQLAGVGAWEDRILWTFAAYNCGPLFVRRALALAARDGNGQPAWWPVTKQYLFHHEAYETTPAGGRLWPDYRAVWVYVNAITNNQLRIRDG